VTGAPKLADPGARARDREQRRDDVVDVHRCGDMSANA
jgi:hypothetical protein